MVGTIDFDEPTDEKLSFDTPTTATPPKEKVAAQRAIKADYGLRDTSPGAGELYNGILAGNESSLRQGGAVDESVDFINRRNAMIGDIARAHGGNLDPNTMAVLHDMTKADFTASSMDPMAPDGAQTIFERKFAERFHTDALRVNEHNTQSPIQRGLQSDPDTVLREADISQHASMIREYAKTLGEELQTEWENTGWLSAGAQYAGQFLPFVSAYNLHNILQGPNTAKSVLPGENLGQGIDHLLRLPRAEAVQKLKAAVDEVRKTSTLDAITLVQAVTRYTSLDSFVNDLVGVTDAAGIATTVGKGVLRLGAAGAERFSLARAAKQRAARTPVSAAESAQSAVNEMSQEAGIPQPKPKTYYLPRSQIENIEIEQRAEGAISGFKTSKGDFSYTPADKTQFIPEAAFRDLRIPEGKETRLVRFKDGDLGLSVRQDDGKWSIPVGSQKFTPQDLPKEGLVPFTYGRSTNFGSEIFNDVSFGDTITSVNRAAPEPTFHLDRANGTSVIPRTAPTEGTVPVHIWPDGRVEYGQPVRGDIYHFPKEVYKHLRATQKFGRAPEYTVDFTKDGQPVLYLGPKKNKVFSLPTEKSADTIPVEISRDGKHIEFIAAGPEMDDVRKAVGDATKAIGSPELKPAEVLSQIGDHDKAAMVIASQRLATGSIDEMVQSLPSGMNPSNFFGKGAALSQSFARKMIDKFTADTQNLTRVLGELNVSRLSRQAVDVGLREAQDALKATYGGRVGDGFLNFLHVPPELNPNKANLDTVIMRMGDLNGRPFESRAMAEQYMRDVYKFGPEEAHIGQETHVGQQGSSFYVQIGKHIDEETEAVRKANIVPANTTPVSMTNMLLNRLRTSEDLLADLQRDNRHIATHAPQVLNKLLREQIDSTSRSLTKKQRRNVEDILRLNRDEINPATNERGIFYTSADDFEQAYFRKFGVLPSQEETAHYFNYTRVSDYDYLIRNLAMYRDKGRLSVQQYSFKAKGAGDIPFFEGKELQSFPWGGQNAGILVHDSETGARFMYKHGNDGLLDQASRTTVDELIKERGFKVVQVFDPTKRPFSKVDFEAGRIDEQIHFVVTDSLDRKPLAFQQLPYRPGGHSIYMDDWYVKQPQLRIGQAGRLHYYGDNAVMNFATEAEARKYAERLDTARIMLKNGDPNLDAYLANNIPYSKDDFVKMFGKEHLDLDTPIVFTKSGTSTFDTVSSLKPEYRNMVDATKSEYNLAGSIDQSFTADRNMTLDTVHETNAGFFGIAPGRQLDPYEAMNQALGQGVRNLWMNDYKIGAVQQWIEEFGDVMKPDFKALSNNPMYFLYHPQWNEATVDKARLAAAKTSQRAIVNFVGARSEIGSQIEFMQNKLMNSIYGNLGQSSAQFTADHLLPAIKDPASYVRAVAFHSKLGMFNPVQMFVQMQSLANILAVAGPTHGVPGSAAGFMMRRMAHTTDPAIIEHFAEKMTALGWKKDDFLEMYAAFRKTGLYEVAGEAALRDDVFDPKLFRSTFGAILDKGTFFFNEGERAVRLSAFATAYREWKVANQGVELTNREIGRIMSRSDTLSASMTRASAASWQNGVMSIPTQFLAYNARIMEQMFSKRLTAAEKARMFGTYSALYGIPTSFAAVAGVWPLYDDIKEEAMKRGIDLSPAYMKGMIEGIPSMMFSVVTGKDYNFAQRWGPGGTTVFRDLIRGDKGIFETMGGASASIIGDIAETTMPAARAVKAMIWGQSEKFPTRKEDFLAIANNVSTMNLATRIYTALAYGKYISKNNVQVGDMDGMDAVMSIMGVTPQNITDTYIKSKAGKEDQQVKKNWEELALKEYANGLGALSRGDYQGFHDYMSRFNTYMGHGDFTVEDRMRIETRANEYKPDLNEKVNEDFWRRSPASQQINRMQNFFTNRGQ